MGLSTPKNLWTEQTEELPEQRRGAVLQRTCFGSRGREFKPPHPDNW